MFVSWGLLLTFGAIFARFSRNLPNVIWFRVHRVTQYIGFPISLAGVILIIVKTPVHFTTGLSQYFHEQLGISITGLALIQVIGAFFRPHPTEDGEDPTTGRVIFEWFHRWVGRTLPVIAAFQIYSGIQLIGYPIYVTYAYLAFVIILFIVVVIMEIGNCCTHKFTSVPICCCTCGHDKMEVV